MAKSKIEISTNDRKVLDALMVNARQSSIEISEKTGLSRQTVQKTISKLEKDHVIWGHKTVVDLNKIGKKRFVMLIKANPNLTKEKTMDGISKVRKMMDKEKSGDLIYSGYYNGLFDWLIIFAAKDVIQANKILRQWKSYFPDFIDEVYLLEEMLATRDGRILNPDYEQSMSKIF